MAFLQSFNTRVLVGPLNLSCEARDVSTEYTIEALDVTVLCDRDRAFIAGRSNATFSASGPLDVSTTAGDPYDVLVDWTEAIMPITHAPRGLTALNEAILIGGLNTNFTPSSPVAETVNYSVSAQASGSDLGFVLEDLTAITANGNGSSRDLTAGSSNGGVAHLHVTAYSGLTSNVITLEHSTNGSTGWSTLGTFATVTGLTSERLSIAAGTTVNRYLRVVDNVTGTGSCTRSVAFARR